MTRCFGACILVLWFFPGSVFASDKCPDQNISSAKKEEIARTVEARYGFQPQSNLYVAETVQIPGSCYIRIQLRIKGSDQALTTDFLLSPDRRFLSRETIDLLYESVEGQGNVRQLLKKRGLLKTPRLGSPGAQIVISFFQDYQCPLCREQDRILRESVFPRYSDKVTVVYYFFPLPSHLWARPAAELGVCINFQNSSSFWRFHESVYRQLERTELDEHVDWLTRLSFSIPGIDLLNLNQCRRSETGSTAVESDLKFGKELGVYSTPTIFLGGQRIVGLTGSEVLGPLIEGQLKMDVSMTPTESDLHQSGKGRQLE